MDIENERKKIREKRRKQKKEKPSFHIVKKYVLPVLITAFLTISTLILLKTYPSYKSEFYKQVLLC